MGFKPDPITGGPKLDTSPTSSVTVSGFKPDQEEYKEPSFDEKSGAVAYGAGTGVVGSLGELEKFGAYTVPETLGFREEGQKDDMGFGRETLFPTIDDARKYLEKIGVTRPREEVRGYETGGEIVGGLVSSAPSAVKTGTKALLGTPTRVRELNARIAEKLGFKLSPAQVRAIEPVSGRGATSLLSDYANENQILANKLASEGTGVSTTNLRESFIKNRISKLGEEYNKLYKGKQFKIDNQAVSALEQIAAREAPLPNIATVSPVYQTAVSILDRVKNEGLVIAGDDLQRMRNALSASARTGKRTDSHEIYEFINTIDNSVGKYQPELKETLAYLNPKYRNSIILEDLYRAGGIEGGDISLEKLGSLLKGGRDAVRGGKADIDQLSRLGSELGLRARWETEGKKATGAAEALESALSTKLSIIPKGLGLRSATARKAQKALARKPVKGYERAGAVTGAGAVGGGVFDSNE